jgi:hypothetical protein
VPSVVSYTLTKIELTSYSMGFPPFSWVYLHREVTEGKIGMPSVLFFPRTKPTKGAPSEWSVLLGGLGGQKEW